MKTAGFLRRRTALFLGGFFVLIIITTAALVLAQDDSQEDAAATAGTTAPSQPQQQAAPPTTAEETQQAAPPPAAEEEKHPNIIIEVMVRGNQIVSTNTILSKLRSQKGGPLVQETVNEDVKRLYASGFFQDIRMEVEDEAEGFRLIVSVLEKPIVREIVIEGFKVFKEQKLRKEIKIIEGQILDRKQVKQGVEAIRKLYSDKGYGFVDIQSDVKLNSATKEVTILIHIVEGGKFKIKDVKLSGVTAFKTKKLIKMMRTRKKSFPLHSGVYKENYFI